MASNPITKVSEEEYLALDRAAEVRSEYLDGEMWAMSGVSLAHARIQLNLYNALQPALREKGCEVLPSDFRVRLSRRTYVYPDVTIVCGKPLLADEPQDILLNPAAVFEILSPTTEAYDRGAKFQHYLRVDSLKDYILVDQSNTRLEHYARGSAGAWTFRAYERLDDELKIDAIGVSLPLSRIYDRVELRGA